MKYLLFLCPSSTESTKKLLLLSSIAVFPIYILSILKCTKDSIIVTKVGAELISSIKIFGVIPASILFILGYAKLSNHLKKTQIYHLLNSIFLLFFIIFDFMLYPNAEKIHFDLQNIIEKFPTFKYQLLMASNWSYTLFYIMADLWGSIMFGLMFWQLSNEINTVKEAKIFYPLFQFLGGIGLIFSGIMLNIFTTSYLIKNWNVTLHYISISITLAGVSISILLKILSSYTSNKALIVQTRTPKEKISFFESIKYILASKPIRLIVMILFCYGAAINLAETLWKKQINLIYINSFEYAHFIAKVQMLTGLCTMIASIFSIIFLRKITWFKAALITPIAIILTGIPFFLFSLLIKRMIYLQGEMNQILLYISVLLGSAQNILSKSIKYSFSDPTKELLYIPLDQQLKTKGKSIADILGERLGKASGSVIQWLILMFNTSLTLIHIAPLLFILFILVLIAWFLSLYSLNKEFIGSHASSFR